MNTPSRRRMEQDNTRPEQSWFASHLPSISPLPRQNNSLYCNTVYNTSRWSYYPRGTREGLSLQRGYFAAHRNVFVCLQARLTVCILNLSLPPLPNLLLWLSVAICVISPLQRECSRPIQGFGTTARSCRYSPSVCARRSYVKNDFSEVHMTHINTRARAHTHTQIHIHTHTHTIIDPPLGGSMRVA